MKLFYNRINSLFRQQEYLKRVVVLGLIFAAALAFRLYRLGSHTLWYDEAITVLDNRGLTQLHPLGRLFDKEFVISHYDYLTLYSHGVIYYWRKLFGESEFTLRSSSVLFAILFIYLLYLIGKKFLDIKIAFLASSLLAVSPFHIYYSQELRPYAIVSFLTLLSAYSLLKILEGNKKLYWFIYVITNVLNVYFLYTNLLILFSSLIFMLLKAKKDKFLLRPVIFAHLTILFFFMPVLWILYQNLDSVFHHKLIYGLSDFPIWVWAESVSFKNLLFTFKNFSTGYNTDYYSFIGKFITALYFCFF